MKNKLWIMLLGILLIGNVLALDSLGTFLQGTTVNITQTCDDATYITLSSVSFPNSTGIINPTNMTKVGSGLYYYEFSNTQTKGRYYVTGISDGCEGTFTTYFDITTEADKQQSNYIGIALIALLGVITSIFLYIKLSKFFGAMLIMLIGFGMLFTATAIGWIGWIIIASGLLMIVYSLMDSKKEKGDYYSLRG